MGSLAGEWHRFAQSKRSVQEKKPRENRRRRTVFHSGAYKGKITPPHLTTPTHTLATSSSHTKNPSLSNLQPHLQKTITGKRKKKPLLHKRHDRKVSEDAQNNPQCNTSQRHLKNDPVRVHLENFFKFSSI